MSVRLLVPWIALAAVSACSNDPAVPPHGLVVVAEDPCAANSTKQCNAIVNDGPTVVPEFVATALPAPMGGTIADGKWQLTAYTVHTPDGQPIDLGELNWVSGVVMIAGTTWQTVTGSRSEDQPDSPRTSTNAVTVSGTVLTFQQTCPCQRNDGSIEFTATARELRTFAPGPGATFEITYTLQ